MNSFAVLHVDADVEENDMITEYRESEMTRSSGNIDEPCNRDEGRNNNTSERPLKRSRELDQDEIWSTMVRKAKLYGRAHTENNVSMRIPEYKIEVSVTCTEKLPKQFGLAKLLKAANIKNVLKIKYINSFKALIHFHDEDSADSFIHCKSFNENGFKCQRTLETTQSYGVIKYIDLDLKEDEILQELKSETEILSVKRLKRKNTNDGHWESSESVRICFKGSSLPSHIYIYDTRVNVSPYTYPVTQCSRCWRFGHSLRMCPSLKVICPKCSKSHPNCETANYKCNNCTGRHMAMAKICPVYLKEKKIRELMAESNYSYKKALTLYIPPSPRSLDLLKDPPLPISSAVRTNEPPMSATPQESSTVEDHTYAKITKEVPGKLRKKSKAEKGMSRNKTKEKVEDIKKAGRTYL
ncbi:reverse transcriptase [Operophtera brumata]|uniref:Reverse transcriptase n=1 Tax=Operophtera brumata TaxID=104452 RepID=A0A0L7KKI3_OPEBR|nr:reverse transcriptase [Operophtera brumata]